MRSLESSVNLAPLTTLGVGGAARWCVRAESMDDVREANAWARGENVPLVVLAGGSNMLVADAGFDGLVLHMCSRGVTRSSHGDEVLVTAAAGEPWDELVAWAVAQGLAGIECLSGIPGTVGGTPVQNVGAYGQEVSKSIESVSVFDPLTRSTQSFTADACDFAYRSSRFKTRDAGRLVVCSVTFRLRPGPATITYPDLLEHLTARGISKPTLSDARDAVLAVRQRKGMVLNPADVDTRSVGSFFTNPVLNTHTVDDIGKQTDARVPTYPFGPDRVRVPAAWLLEKAGFGRGYGEGAVGLSSKHPLAIINRGGATSAGVVAFAADIKRKVAELFGVYLMPEPTFVGFEDCEHVKYLLEETA